MSQINAKVLGSLISGIGLMYFAGKKINAKSDYYNEVARDLNEAERLYRGQSDPNAIVAQFAIAQDKVHSSKFEQMNASEQKEIADRFTNLGNAMMQG